MSHTPVDTLLRLVFVMALVRSESSSGQSREQLELLAGIEVTAKAVERQARAR